MRLTSCTRRQRVEVGVEDRVVVGRADPGVVERDVDAAVALLRRREQPRRRRPCSATSQVHVGAADLPATRAPLASSRSAMTTVAPSCANRRTVASPMPEQPPVTTATLPSSLPAMVQPSRRAYASSVLMKTFLTSVNASSASGPSSRPMPGSLEPAERRRVAHRAVAVDREVPGLDATGHPDGATDVAGPDRPRQAVGRVVGLGDRVGLVVERHHRDDRPEDLLAPHPVVRAAGQHHGRRVPAAGALGGSPRGRRRRPGRWHSST